MGGVNENLTAEETRIVKAARVSAVSELLHMAEMCSASDILGVRAIAHACLQRVLLIHDGETDPAFYTPPEANRLAKRIIRRLQNTGTN
jgi:hypothetical protein